MTSSKWWYTQDGKVYGPINDKVLSILMFNGTIGPQHWLWRDGLTGWTMLTGIAELQGRRQGVSPDLREQPEPNAPLPNPLAPLPARPIARAGAQLVDLNLTGLLVGTTVGLAVAFADMPESVAWAETSWGQILFAWILVPISLIAQALLLRMVGTTPGKALLGLRVVHLDGRSPSLQTLLRRHWRLWGAGWAYGIPLINLMTSAANRTLVRDGKPTAWDEENGLVVLERTAGWFRPALAFTFYILLQFNGAWLALLGRVTGADVVTTENPAPAVTLSATWRNPVTGQDASLVTGWETEAEPQESGGTVYWFWKTGRDGVGRIERSFLDQPFADFYTTLVQDAGQPVPAAIPTPAPGQPVCVRYTKGPADGQTDEALTEVRTCTLSSGEIWTIAGRWPSDDVPEQSRVKSLLDGLESTIR